MSATQTTGLVPVVSFLGFARKAIGASAPPTVIPEAAAGIVSSRGGWGGYGVQAGPRTVVTREIGIEPLPNGAENA